MRLFLALLIGSARGFVFKPVLVDPSPAAGSVLDATSGFTVEVSAITILGRSITDFQYETPIGMSCTDVVIVNTRGTAECSWNPTDAQSDQVFDFCFSANDSSGATSERRCVALSVGSKDEPVDECTTSAHTCDDNAFCTNTETSYTCACAAGYDGNGVTCTGKSLKCYIIIY